MSAQNESQGPVILFFIVWWILAHEPNYEDHAFVYALLLMFIGWLAIRMAGNAACRLGKRAWLLMLQVGGWFVLFLSFVPGVWYLKVLALWGYGIPLLFAGGAARLIYERFPKCQKEFDVVPRGLCVIMLIFGPVVSWHESGGFWAALWQILVDMIFAAIPLY